MRAWLLWLALLGPALALAADATGSVRLSAFAGLDTNPGRDFGDLATSDAALSLLGVTQGQLRWERAVLAGRYELGGRGFGSQTDADLWAQAAQFEAAWTPGAAWQLGVEGRAKDRHAGARGRAYADLAGGPFVAFSASPHWDFELHAQARRFLLRDALPFSFGGGELDLVSRYRLDRHHGLTLTVHGAHERYDANAVDRTGASLGFAREDSRLGGAVGYRYRGGFALSLEYAFDQVGSTSFGEAQLRNRVSATAGIRLPARLMLFVDLALQLTRYPDGVYLSPEILLLEDDENLSAAAARLVRPLSEHVDVELRYGLYQTRLGTNGLSYLRQLATAGVTLRF